jgi:hypothetical protein
VMIGVLHCYPVVAAGRSKVCSGRLGGFSTDSFSKFLRRLGKARPTEPYRERSPLAFSPLLTGASPSPGSVCALRPARTWGILAIFQNFLRTGIGISQQDRPPTSERQGRATSGERSVSVGGLGYEVAMADPRRDDFPNNFVGETPISYPLALSTTLWTRWRSDTRSSPRRRTACFGCGFPSGLGRTRISCTPVLR